MPNPTTKTRQAIKNRFVRNAIPTQADFADLIDASLNQADDGLLKLPNEPLGLVRQQPDKPVLRFYDSPDATESAWQIYLSADNKAGFALVNTNKDGATSTRLFLDAATGNVGIGTTQADARLTVQGGMQIADTVTIGGRVDILTASNPIRFSSTWIGFPDDKTNGAEISNDVTGYKTLMIVGNKSAGGPRSVSIWDVLNVNGSLNVKSTLTAIGTTSLAALTTTGNIAMNTDAFCLNSINKNIGIGTIASNDFKLDVSGSVRLGGFTIGDSFEWPKLVWLRDIPNNWDEGLLKHASNQGFFRRQGFGIHLDESRDFHIFSSGMNALFGVEGGSGNASIKGNLTVRGSGVKDPDSGMSGVGQLAIKGTSPQIDFIDADRNDWSIHVNSNKMYFIRQPWEFKDLVLDGAGSVGIGTDSPAARLQITGNVSITSAEGQNFACKSNHMAPGSLTIGGNDRNYGGGNYWNSNTAGLLLEALDNTEIAIHDSGVRLASFMYYEGAMNQFTIGRDMGWGPIATVNVQGALQATKLNIFEATGTAATASAGSLLLDHNDSGGASSIVFRSKVNRGGGDYAFLEYRDKNPSINDCEAGLLTIGIQNDVNDNIALMPSGSVGIGTDSPAAKLQITGNVSITSAEGQNFACKSNYMAPGSLTIGGIDRNYGGGNNWNSSTAGLLLEALDNTEIAIHNSGVGLASFMYYEGAKNQFTIGRDMGWGLFQR